MRDPISCNDIQGASNRVPYVRKQPYDSHGYNDIYAKDWQTSRRTNPLNPEYSVRDSIQSGDFLKKDSTSLNGNYGVIERNVP